MIMQRFAQFLINRRLNAIVLALLFSVVGFLRWVGSVIAGFITIRKGPLEGGLVFLWTLLPVIVLWTLEPSFWPYFAVYIGLQMLLWAMAIVLGYRNDYAPALYLLTIVGCIAVIAFVYWVGDIDQWIIHHMTLMIQDEKQMLTSGQVTELKNYRDQFASLSQAYPTLGAMMGCGFPMLLMGLWVTVNLLIARMLDRSLDKPEQFSQEFGMIHIEYFYSLVALLIVALAVYLRSTLLMAIIPVILFPLVIGGISIIHHLIINTRVPNFLLLIFYLVIVISLIMLVAFPVIALILIFAALLDSVFNFRRRLLTSL